MAWLATLDAKARQWPIVARWPYRAVKWLLIAVGAWCAIGLAYQELREHRVGLGLGIVVAFLLAGIKGVIMAVHRSAPPQ